MIIPASTCPLSISLQYDVSPVRTSLQGSWSVDEAELCRASGFTFDGVVQPVPRTTSACDLRAYEEDFFNAIYFIPPAVNLQSVATDTRVGVLLWNAFLEPRELQGINLVGFEGIELNGPEPVTTFLPLQLVDYEFVFSPAGPPDIDASAQLLFDQDNSATLPITGTRSGQLFLIPNWREPVRRTYSFLSDIATGRTQRETRRQLRDVPRISLRYTHTGFFFRIQKMIRFFQSNPDLITAMPDWVSNVQLSAPTAADSTEFTIEQGRPWIAPGATVFIHIRGNKNEDEEFLLTTIDEVTLTGFTTQAQAGRVWPIGTVVYRGLNGRLSANTRVSVLTNNLAEIQIEFAVDPGQEMLYEPGLPIRSFQGRELFDIEESWAGPQDLSYVKERIVSDMNRGRIREVSFLEYTPEIFQMAFDQFDLDEVFEIERFFLRQRGRVGEFWRSMRLPDFNLVAPIQTGQTSVTVEGEDVFEIYRDDPSKVAVELETLDGRRFQRAILSIETGFDPGTSELIFNEPWDEDIPLEQVQRLSWLNVWRLTSDDLVVEWITDETAQISLSIRSIVVEPLDDIDVGEE